MTANAVCSGAFVACNLSEPVPRREQPSLATMLVARGYAIKNSGPLSKTARVRQFCPGSMGTKSISAMAPQVRHESEIADPPPLLERMRKAQTAKRSLEHNPASLGAQHGRSRRINWQGSAIDQTQHMIRYSMAPHPTRAAASRKTCSPITQRNLVRHSARDFLPPHTGWRAIWHRLVYLFAKAARRSGEQDQNSSQLSS